MYKFESINHQTGVYAKTVADSIADGSRLITLELKAPKFLDAEFEKHRMISSNSSSDRAVPFKRMLEADYYKPWDVRLNQSGMQGFVSLNEKDLSKFHDALERIRNEIIFRLQDFDTIHKQHLNRYLSPFSFQYKVATATLDQWLYLLGLRMHREADPAIQDLAFQIHNCINSNVPDPLQDEDWHLPYIMESDFEEHWDREILLTKSAARCARVSYMNHNKQAPTYGEDKKLYDFLYKSIGSTNQHLTPMEHQAQVRILEDHMLLAAPPTGLSHVDMEGNWWSGNFKQPWIQLRKMLEQTK